MIKLKRSKSCYWWLWIKYVAYEVDGYYAINKSASKVDVLVPKTTIYFLALHYGLSGHSLQTCLISIFRQWRGCGDTVLWQ